MWVVGAKGLLLHRTGGQWQEVTSPVTTDLRDVAMVTATDGWAVGAEGAILHWDGQAWTKTASGTTATLTSIVMRSADDGWAAGLASGRRRIPPLGRPVLEPGARSRSGGYRAGAHQR